MKQDRFTNKFLRASEVAALIGCSTQWVGALVMEGELESHRLRPLGWHRIPAASLEEYAKRNDIRIDWESVL